MYDGSPLQPIAHGEVSNGTVAPGFAAVSSGCVIARTGAGTYTVTLNAQAGAGAVDAAASRIECTATTALQGCNVVKTSNTVFTVTTYVGAGGPNVATDGTFDIIISRDPTVLV